MKSSRKRKKEWFDNDGFWRQFYPFMFSERRFAETGKEVARLLKLAKPRGKSALDLACGPGRCSIALAKRGFHVTGVDRTKFLLDKARAMAKSARAKVEWVHQDMRDFVRPSSFHFALSMFTSFGYFDDRREDMLVLKNIFASLKPGGVFVIELLGKERLAKIFQPTVSNTLPDGTLFIQRHEVFDDWTRIRNQWILLRGRKAKSFTFHHTVYSGQELRDRLEQTGFTDVKLYGNLDAAPYGPDAERLVAVARKS